MSVLKLNLLDYELDIPDFDYVCSIPFSSTACDYSVGNSLKDRSEYFGIELNDHHDALCDASTCASLILRCIEKKKMKSFHSYLSRHSSIVIRNINDLNPKRSIRKSRFEKIVFSEIEPTVDNFDSDHPFYNKNIVLTGDLTSMNRKVALHEIVNVGGIIKSGVSRKTDYLVVGIQDKSLVGEDGMSTKEAKAYSLIDRGYDIKIIYEDEFLALLRGLEYDCPG